jgi:hypothetical protein
MKALREWNQAQRDEIQPMLQSKAPILEVQVKHHLQVPFPPLDYQT